MAFGMGDSLTKPIALAGLRPPESDGTEGSQGGHQSRQLNLRRFKIKIVDQLRNALKALLQTGSPYHGQHRRQRLGGIRVATAQLRRTARATPLQ